MKVLTMKRVLIGLAMAGFGSSVFADGVWIADANGCKVWDSSPKANESVTWSGACSGGYAEGSGLLQWTVDGKPSSRFEGTFSGGKRNGKGVVTAPSGFGYEGNFVDDRYSGKGMMTFTDGGRYEGDFVAGQRTGKGVIAFNNGNRYEGDFIEGKLTGKGVMTFGNGNRYEGDFLEGKLTGRGVYTWKAGDRYEGDIVNGKPNGKGEIKLVSGDRYVGDFVDGKRTGKGIYTWVSGDRFEGDFVDGKRTENGTLTKGNQAFGIKDDSPLTGSSIKRERVHGALPFDKTYAQLTEEEKARFKAAYEKMGPNDEPPFPLQGLGPLYALVQKANKKIGAEGLLDLDVTIDSTGTPVNVSVFHSPDPDLTTAAAQFAMLTKFKPAVCNGQPCRMNFPMRINFERKL
jgi:hypothetical protein